MAGAREGGRERLGILIASLVGLLLLALHTIGGAASASHRPPSARVPGKIVAIAARRPLPLDVRRQLAVPRPAGPATVRISGATYLLGGTRRGAKGRKVPVGSVLRRVGGARPARVAKLPVPVTGAAGAAVGDRIYAFGGRLAHGKPSDLIEEYDVATERSVIAGRLLHPVADSAALTLGDFVYLLGGRVAGSPTREIVRFDPWRATTAVAGRLPVAASGGVAAASRLDRGYLVGANVAGAPRLNLEITLRPRGAGH
jgi:hypothetical protein